MRHNFLALAGLAAALAVTAPAFALNPQPLPPGIHQPTNHEPPDPCLRYRGHPRAYARCVAAHKPKPSTSNYNEAHRLSGGDGGIGE
jgi:hypothetical protein